MINKSIGREMLICQCLSKLPLEDFDCPLIDYAKTKLTTKALLKIFVAAQLDQWSSYEHMTEKLGAYPKLREEIGIQDISSSQLSRRINDLPTEWVQTVFEKIINKVKILTEEYKGMPHGIGRLNIVDSTELRLPKQLCDWAYISKDYHAVKMHTRLVVASPDVAYPDKIIPSTGTVGDVETNILFEESDATYVVDRAYPSKNNLMDWQKRNISFVARLSKSLRVFTLEEYEITHPSVIRDAKVEYGISKDPVRYIEFVDEESRVYRILTSRFDLTAEDIMDIYRNRWIIELFFKWTKQHLRFTKIWSTKPQGIWNQMFLALIAYALSLIVKLETQSKKTSWEFFRLLQTYLYKPVCQFKKSLRKKPKKTSRGRQKVPIPNKKNISFGNVAMVKEQKVKKNKTAERKLGNY
ncbi:IS4 family transposase [Bacillus sp. HMF5848]|uniref:IS4 family transposase n=1 Tax=Bacillus sp. HMF5848 TaxID=2495421 RepID=UPI000F782ED9|nr:IS4 family transposase [Bacillus sp. HMF5848]RSK26098.1 IS4 family transposase [Bacillus sp. HMF5848]RSK28847.1 IS4 family transposase [Bacillus sp. HMF5848]